MWVKLINWIMTKYLLNPTSVLGILEVQKKYSPDPKHSQTINSKVYRASHGENRVVG